MVECIYTSQCTRYPIKCKDCENNKGKLDYFKAKEVKEKQPEVPPEPPKGSGAMTSSNN